MIRAVVRYYDTTGKDPISVIIGVGEDLKAPRDLAALESAGWPIDEGFAMTYKAWLAGKRQGDIADGAKFVDWMETVQDLDLKPSRKQIEQAVALGKMDGDSAERLLKALESDEGEAAAQPA